MTQSTKAAACLLADPTLHWQRFEEYTMPSEVEQIQTYRWYMGVPPARREGRPGVSYMRAGFLTVRAERLRQANYPEPGFAAGSDVLLGEAAHQLRWTRSPHDQHVRLAD